LLPAIKKQKGIVVNVISDFALMGFPGKTTYGSSKAAVMGFTHCLYTELAGTGVAVSLVIPPPMATGIVMQGKHIDAQKQLNEMRFLQQKGMPVEKAARKIADKIKRRKLRIVTGGMMQAIDVVSRIFPTITHRLIAKRKGTFDFI
jgi:short-subunit dehydrogenase